VYTEEDCLSFSQKNKKQKTKKQKKPAANLLEERRGQK